MDNLRAEYGVLANGESFRLYRRGQDSPLVVVSMGSVSDSDCRDIESALQKRDFELTDPDDVDRFIDDLDPIPSTNRLSSDKSTFSILSGSKPAARLRTL